jgi:hypothetical protein
MFPVMFSEALGLKVTFIEAFWPAAKVTGKDMPLAVKSLAFTATCEIVRLVLPLFVMVTLLELEEPALTPENVRLLGFEDIVTEAAVPPPLSAKTFGEFGALLLMLTVPDWLPAVVGANKTLKVAVPPAATVAGVARPLTLKAAPETARSAIVRAAVPVFVIVITCDLVWPSTMLPKLKEAGEIERPGAAAVPVTGMLKGELPALLTIVIAPLVLPLAEGEKTALKVTL